VSKIASQPGNVICVNLKLVVKKSNKKINPEKEIISKKNVANEVPILLLNFCMMLLRPAGRLTI
jgi:hypothetical protein